MRHATHTVLRCLVAGCLLAATALTTGCSREQDRALVILGPWTGDEEEAFEAHTIPILEEKVGRHIVYEGTRSPRETLVAQLRAESPPDVAILNSLGELVEYAKKGALRPLSGKTAKRAIRPWAPDIVLSGESEAYWVPVRIDLKSIVWTRAEVADPVTQWCLGMSDGAGSGWPGTDWIEDLILQRHGWATYQDWATGRLSWESQEVRQAWLDWATMLQNGGFDREALKASLTTHFEQLPGRESGLLNSGGCTREHQGSFIRRHYGDGEDVRPSPLTDLDLLPFTPAEPNVFEVSGDMAAVFDTSDDAATRLLSALTSDDARDKWISGIDEPSEWPLFPGWPEEAGEEAVGTYEVQRLLEGADTCFDASDAMPPTLRDAFYRAVLEFLSALAGTNPWEEQLEKLLGQLDEERQLQHKEGAFVIDALCRSGPH